ncbi:MAG: hypothetical protein JNN15_07145 [Blastocatellia bacterium]|nr:hypothetical protein [Blastocatellia bacterium]
MSRATVQLSLQSRKVWIYSSVLDLIVGCGAWSLPLMILAYLLGTKSLFVASVTFYALALFANNPHYMATIYRAYRDSEDFYRYKLFTVYITGLMLIIALLCHIAPSLFLWVFTLYVTWSPWHYAGQNFGLLMMFVRRNTDVSKTERNALYTAFLASYLILFLSFHSGTSADPNLISLGIPLAFAKIARITLLVVSLYLSFYVFWKLVRRASIASMIAPLTLISTQFIWFMLPTVLEISYGAEITQTSYSSGVLAFMHSAQYLWITSYYAKREVERNGVYASTF